jgi:hypothetical protein
MKKKYPLRMGSAEVPFPQARPTKALQEEDAFMETHGGAGPRNCYYIAQRLGLAVEAIPMITRRILTFIKTWANLRLPSKEIVS